MVGGGVVDMGSVDCGWPAIAGADQLVKVSAQRDEHGVHAGHVVGVDEQTIWCTRQVW